MLSNDNKTGTCNTRCFAVGLFLLFVGLPILCYGFLGPFGDFEDDGQYIAAITLISLGSACMFAGIVLMIVAAVRESSVIHTLFGFGTLRNDLLYMIYSFGLLCCWAAIAYFAGATWCPGGRYSYTDEGIVSIVFAATSLVWVAAFAFFARRALLKAASPADEETNAA